MFYAKETFRSNFFVSEYRKFSLGNTSVFRKNSGNGKIYASERGGITVLSNIFVSQDQNEELCKGTLSFPRNCQVSKKIYGQKGAYHDFQSKVLCLTLPKSSVGETVENRDI